MARGRRRRGLLVAVLLLATVLVALTASFLGRQPQPTGVEGAWELAFHEEFDGDRLDGDRWNDHEPWQGDGWGINSAWHPVPATRDQLSVSQGIATLKARRAESLPDGKAFTTVELNTRDMYSLPEGATTFTEARLRAPSSKGLLPAFWLLGDGTNDTGEGWPVKGEVDIVEFANNEGEAARPFASVWYPRDVYENPPGTFLNGIHDTHPDSFEPRPELRDFWHTWGLYRSPDRMDVYIDGERRFTFRPGETYKQEVPLPDVLFNSAMHVRFSLGVGGDWAGDGWSEDEYEEGDLEVDYVRSWTSEDD